jgi:hypothetical protein
MSKSKKSTDNSNSFRFKPKKVNKGIHSKTKQSKNKKSKNYQKLYIGQGR